MDQTFIDRQFERLEEALKMTPLPYLTEAGEWRTRRGSASEFMFMTSTREDTPRYVAFKHRSTRNYVHLRLDGEVYIPREDRDFRRGDFGPPEPVSQQVLDRVNALARVTDGMSADAPGYAALSAMLRELWEASPTLCPESLRHRSDTGDHSVCPRCGEAVGTWPSRYTSAGGEYLWWSTTAAHVSREEGTRGQK